jgi:hypothetical protein
MIPNNKSKSVSAYSFKPYKRIIRLYLFKSLSVISNYVEHVISTAKNN